MIHLVLLICNLSWGYFLAEGVKLQYLLKNANSHQAQQNIDKLNVLDEQCSSELRSHTLPLGCYDLILQSRKVLPHINFKIENLETFCLKSIHYMDQSYSAEALRKITHRDCAQKAILRSQEIDYMKDSAYTSHARLNK